MEVLKPVMPDIFPNDIIKAGVSEVFQAQLNSESVEFRSTSIHKALMKNGIKR